MTAQLSSSSNSRKRPRTGRNRLSYLATTSLAAIAVAIGMATRQQLVVGLAVALIFVAICWGWPGLVGLPNRGVSRAGIAAIGLAALLCAAFGSSTHLAYVAAFGVPVVYIGEMLRRDGRTRLLTQVAGTYAGGLLGIGAALWKLVANEPGGFEFGLSAMAGMALAGIAGAFVRGSLILLAVPVAAALGSGAVAWAATDLPWWPAIVFAVILGVLAWGLEQVTPAVLSQLEWSSKVSFALIPFSAMGVVGYALALLLF